MGERTFDFVWCVFDRDNHNTQHFNNAIKLAKEKKIGLAYSNEAFEIWYLLHFHYFQNAGSRKRYKKLLTKELGEEYEKNSEEMYDLLLPKQALAIKHAKKLIGNYVPHRPAKDNPYTNVFELVEELNRYL